MRRRALTSLIAQGTPGLSNFQVGGCRAAGGCSLCERSKDRQPADWEVDDSIPTVRDTTGGLVGNFGADKREEAARI